RDSLSTGLVVSGNALQGCCVGAGFAVKRWIKSACSKNGTNNSLSSRKSQTVLPSLMRGAHSKWFESHLRGALEPSGRTPLKPPDSSSRTGGQSSRRRSRNRESQATWGTLKPEYGQPILGTKARTIHRAAALSKTAASSSFTKAGTMPMFLPASSGPLSAYFQAHGRMRLLLISKFAIVRSALRHLLASSNDIEVVAESDLSPDVEETVRKLRPDVILIETAVASDPEEARVIEKIGRGSKVRLVVLAGEGDIRVIRSMLRSGVTGYVLKQSTDTELLLALRSAARGRRFLDSSLINEIAFEGTRSAEQTASPKPVLSKRQKQVLKYLVRGHTGGEIARKLDVSVKTVETYRARIYEKLEVRSRADLMKYAVAAGLISMHEGFE